MSEVVGHKQQSIQNNRIFTPQKSSAIARNFSSASYHSALDLAKAYSGMVNSHLLHSDLQNHALKSACRTYNKEMKKNGLAEAPADSPKIKRSQSTRLSRTKSITKTLRIENNRIVRNPQDQETAKSVALQESGQGQQRQRQLKLKQVLKRKTYRVPEYSSQLEQACAYKTKLEEEIKILRESINRDMKMKGKITLNCNKIMSERELTHKNYKTREEENYHLNTAIMGIQRDNSFLLEEIGKLRKKNEDTKQSIQNEDRECETVRKYVEKTRMVVMNEEKDVAKLKTMVTTSFNNMSNCYMNLNLLKSEKALLLADIDTNHSRNR